MTKITYNEYNWHIERCWWEECQTKCWCSCEFNHKNRVYGLLWCL